jgi:hypothetical protein
MYSKVGRPSLQMLYSVRSERLLMEEIDYNILLLVRGAELGR